MNISAERILILGGLALAAAGVAYVLARGTQGVARDVARAAAGAVDGAIAGTVEGIGEVIGIPPTNQTQCQRDLAAGKMWDASFSCPAGDYLGAMWDKLKGGV